MFLLKRKIALLFIYFFNLNGVSQALLDTALSRILPKTILKVDKLALESLVCDARVWNTHM